MSAIKIGYINILETSTVTVTTEDADFPAYRLYDRDINKLYKGASTSDQIIKAQQAGTAQAVNALYIPEGHNLNGVAISIQYSSDDSTYTTATSWTQSGTDQILKEFAERTETYWMVVFSGLSNYLNIPECFLTDLYTFTCSPSAGLNTTTKFNVDRVESKSGIAHYLQRGETRKSIIYTLNNISDAEKAEMETWLDEWGGYKPFLFVDMDGDTFFAELTREVSFTYLYNRYTANISVMEVL